MRSAEKKLASDEKQKREPSAAAGSYRSRDLAWMTEEMTDDGET
jgi:hypothetical protein